MSRTLYLEPRNVLPLPMIVSHREWCRWLKARGCLSPQHRKCVDMDHFVGGWAQAVEEAWRSGRDG